MKILVLAGCIFTTACAGKRTTTPPVQDYVEIDNPSATMSPSAPATIWVPRNYVESGVPRGSEVLKMGAEQVVQSIRGTSQQPEQEAGQQAGVTAESRGSDYYAPAQQTAQSPPNTPRAPATRPRSVEPYQQQYREPAYQSGTESRSARNRVAIVEISASGLVNPMYEALRRSAVVGLFDAGESASLARQANLVSDSDKASFAIRMQQDYGVNLVIYLAAPDGVSSGKEVSAEVYDAMGGGLLQRINDIMPSQPEAYGETALLPQSLTEKVTELMGLVPWYGRIIAVQGSRAYVAAGKEAGLRVGQTLKIYRNGRFMKGLGYAPGERVGALTVQGFVGPNGSFCVIKEGDGVEASDIVSIE